MKQFTDEEIKNYEDYAKAVADGVKLMLNAGCRFKVLKKKGIQNLYEPKFLVVLDPQDVSLDKAGCDITSFGQFYWEGPAKLFADSMNAKQIEEHHRMIEEKLGKRNDERPATK